MSQHRNCSIRQSSPLVSDLFADDQRFDEAYDEYEAITAMSYAQEASVRKFSHSGSRQADLVWRDRHSPERSLVARLAQNRSRCQGDQWRYVVAGLFPRGLEQLNYWLVSKTAIARSSEPYKEIDLADSSNSRGHVPAISDACLPRLLDCESPPRGVRSPWPIRP